jgi:hypothetical protein
MVIVGGATIRRRPVGLEIGTFTVAELFGYGTSYE